ncbi:MAG: hypothetical protein ACP6IS_10090 [Candidatus Asgardarchaeia archaeon]
MSKYESYPITEKIIYGSGTYLSYLYTISVTLGLFAIMLYNYYFPPPLPDEQSLPTPLSPGQSLLFITALSVVLIIIYVVYNDVVSDKGRFNIFLFLFFSALVYLFKGISSINPELNTKSLLILDLIALFNLLIFTLEASLILIRKSLRQTTKNETNSNDQNNENTNFSKKETDKQNSQPASFLKNIFKGFTLLGFQILLGLSYIIFQWFIDVSSELFYFSEALREQLTVWWFRLLWIFLTMFLVAQTIERVLARKYIDETDKSGMKVGLFLKSTIKAGTRLILVILIVYNINPKYPGFNWQTFLSSLLTEVYKLNVRIIHTAVTFFVWLNIPTPINIKHLIYSAPGCASILTYGLIMIIFLVCRKLDII